MCRFDQVVTRGSGESIAPNVSLSVRQHQSKWLNVVLDLNGILCECVGRSSLAKGVKTYDAKDNNFSPECPTIVGTKAVYVRPGLRDFLLELTQITSRVVVWSSMLKRNAEPVVEFLFHGLKRPFDIFGQEQCRRIETSRGKFLRHPMNSQKHVYLKVLADQLFSDPSNGFTKDNTLLIDDSPEKSVCNENGNAMFLLPWDHRCKADNFLMRNLAPWLRSLQENCAQGHLREYVDAKRIGIDPVTSSNPLLPDILKGMKESAAVLGSRFEVPGMNIVIDARTCRE